MANPLFDDAKKSTGPAPLFPTAAKESQATPEPPQAAPQTQILPAAAVTRPLAPEPTPTLQPQQGWTVMDTPPAMNQIVHVSNSLPSIPTTVDDSWVTGLGQKESSQIATLSRTLMDKTRGTDLEGFGVKIGELISTAKGLNINDLKSQGIIGKLKGLFASAKERFLNQYNTATKQIDRFMAELQASSTLQQKRIIDLDKLFEANMQEHQNLTVAIAEGSTMVERMRAELANIDTSNLESMAAQRHYDQTALADRLEKRVDDLKRVCMLAEQTAPQIRLMQENSRMLVNKFNDIKNLTIPAWQKQFALQVILLEQERGAKLVESIDDATNEAMRRSADLLRQNTSAINKASQRSVVDLETLEHINKQTIGALEDTRKIVEEGRLQRQQTDGRLEKMRAELLVGLNPGTV
jgi:uncharacterized protein YaaN involved in tellurite resistance